MEEKNLIKRLWKKFVTWETISYIVIGILTTAVNLISFHVLCNKMGIDELIANIIAWIIAVTFAYITNNLIVFRSGVEGKQKEIEKIVKFFSARLVTLGLEELGLLIFVTLLAFPNMIVKVVLGVLVIIVNYIFSKLYIFTKGTK